MVKTIKRRQRLLAALAGSDGRRYYDGPIDGIDGDETQEAAQKFLMEYGFSQPCQEDEGVWDGIRYFTQAECKCRCGGKYCDGTQEPNRKLLDMADRIREEIGGPLIPTSVLRCPEWNIICGGVANSRHLEGKAMDAYSPELTAEQLLAVVQKIHCLRYAYPVDQKVVHFDVE